MGLEIQSLSRAKLRRIMKKRDREAGRQTWRTPLAFCRQRQGLCLYEFKVKPGYRASSSTAWATQKNIVLKTNKAGRGGGRLWRPREKRSEETGRWPPLPQSWI